MRLDNNDVTALAALKMPKIAVEFFTPTTSRKCWGNKTAITTAKPPIHNNENRKYATVN